MAGRRWRSGAWHVLCGVAWLLGAGGAWAQDQPDGLWHGNASIGGSASSGTSSSMLLTAAADATRVTAQDKLALYGLLNNGRSKVNGVSTRTADLARAGGRYDFNLDARTFAFSGVEAESNPLQDLDSRIGVNTGLGYKLVNEIDDTFSIFGGAGYSRSRYGLAGTRQGVELPLGEESTHRLSASSNFKQRLVYFPGASGVGRRATFDSQLSTSILGAWTMNLGLSARYASLVAPGAKRTESLLTVGFGYKF